MVKNIHGLRIVKILLLILILLIIYGLNLIVKCQKIVIICRIISIKLLNLHGIILIIKLGIR
jgi:hypothetical protein